MVLALGSNVGDRLAHLSRAVAGLSARTRVVHVSSVYETEPVGYRKQRDFLNAVAVVRAEMEPREVLVLARTLESESGRRRTVADGPRTLDVDILFHGDRIVDEADLTVPHPRWRERAFVLAPLAEVAPDLVDPVTGDTVRDVWSGWVGAEAPPRRVGGPETIMPETLMEGDR